MAESDNDNHNVNNNQSAAAEDAYGIPDVQYPSSPQQLNQPTQPPMQTQSFANEQYDGQYIAPYDAYQQSTGNANGNASEAYGAQQAMPSYAEQPQAAAYEAADGASQYQAPSEQQPSYAQPQATYAVPYEGQYQPQPNQTMPYAQQYDQYEGQYAAAPMSENGADASYAPTSATPTTSYATQYANQTDATQYQPTFTQQPYAQQPAQDLNQSLQQDAMQASYDSQPYASNLQAQRYPYSPAQLSDVAQDAKSAGTDGKPSKLRMALIIVGAIVGAVAIILGACVALGFFNHAPSNTASTASAPAVKQAAKGSGDEAALTAKDAKKAADALTQAFIAKNVTLIKELVTLNAPDTLSDVMPEQPISNVRVGEATLDGHSATVPITFDATGTATPALNQMLQARFTYHDNIKQWKAEGSSVLSPIAFTGANAATTAISLDGASFHELTRQDFAHTRLVPGLYQAGIRRYGMFDKHFRTFLISTEPSKTTINVDAINTYLQEDWTLAPTAQQSEQGKKLIIDGMNKLDWCSEMFLNKNRIYTFINIKDFDENMYQIYNVCRGFTIKEKPTQHAVPMFFDFNNIQLAHIDSQGYKKDSDGHDRDVFAFSLSGTTTARVSKVATVMHTNDALASIEAGGGCSLLNDYFPDDATGNLICIIEHPIKKPIRVEGVTAVIGISRNGNDVYVHTMDSGDNILLQHLFESLGNVPFPKY